MDHLFSVGLQEKFFRTIQAPDDEVSDTTTDATSTAAGNPKMSSIQNAVTIEGKKEE